MSIQGRENAGRSERGSGRETSSPRGWYQRVREDLRRRFGERFDRLDFLPVESAGAFRGSANIAPKTIAQADDAYSRHGADEIGFIEPRDTDVDRITTNERPRRWRRGGQTARDMMDRNPRVVRRHDSLHAVAQIMADEDTGIVPVVEEDGRLLGVVLERDIVCRLIARGIDPRSARAGDVMTDDIECVTEQNSLHDVLDLMSDRHVHRVPVVAPGDRLVGILSMADVARAADLDEDLQDTFGDISSRREFWARLR